MPSKNKYITALIGCGRIGFLLEQDPLRDKPCTHFGGACSAGLRIDCAADIDSSRLKRFGEQAGIPNTRLYRDYSTLIKDLRPDIVIIATGTDSHAEIGITAARYGARVILCEKPISYSLAEARRLLDACERSGTRLMINHERRFSGRYQAVKKMIDRGRIGAIKTVFANILTGGSGRSSSILEGGGPLLHDGTHMIDIIRYFFGDIARVQGEFERAGLGRSTGYEDRATAWIKTVSGIDVFLEAGGRRNYFIFELQIFGTNGKIVIGNGYERLYLSRKSRLYTKFRDLAETTFPSYPAANCFTREYAELKRLASKTDGACTSSGVDGYKSLETIHAIYQSGYLQGKAIELPVNPGTIDLQRIFNL